jgi:hypothetical protein
MLNAVTSKALPSPSSEPVRTSPELGNQRALTDLIEGLRGGFPVLPERKDLGPTERFGELLRYQTAASAYCLKVELVARLADGAVATVKRLQSAS